MKKVSLLFSVRLMVFTAMLCAVGHLHAQTVTINPATGNLIAAVTQEQEAGFSRGYSSLWMHEQLPLTFLTADETALTNNGLLQVPAGNLIRAKDYQNSITIVSTEDAYFCLALPRGYRFSSYTLVLKDLFSAGDRVNGTRGDLPVQRNGWTFTETDATFQKDIAEAGDPITIAPDSRPDASKDYTLTRTGNLGSVLYFHLQGGHIGSGSGWNQSKVAALLIKSFRITFEVDDGFTEAVVPTAVSAEGVSVAPVPFATNRLDLGQLTWNKKDGSKWFSFRWRNMKDLGAYTLLYSSDAVTNGHTDNTVGTRGIYTVSDDDDPQKLWFGLRPGTYYVETPVSATASGNIEIPLGYRITGARVTFKKKGGTAPDFTITLYDKDGTTVAKTATGSEEEGTLSVTGLNNDAIKISIAGADDARALVRMELNVEALNPYVQSYRVNATTIGDNQSIGQHFTADDFQAGGADAVFAVPEGLAEKHLAITFDQLANKHADDTYRDETLNLSKDGNSRYHFVGSSYYDLLDEKPYSHPTEVRDYDFRQKIAVSVMGNRPFRFNNAADLANDNEDATSDYLRCYPFSQAAYAEEGGVFNKLELTEADIDKEHIVFVFTRDETRYNIAPTWATIHESYAFYECNIFLKSRDYTPHLTYKPIYSHTFHSDARVVDDQPYYGVIVGVSEDLTELGTKGFLTARQVQDQLESDITKGGAGVPCHRDHVLYVDASNLSSIIQGGDDFGNIHVMRDSLAPNALAYLPQGTTVLADNCATLSYTATDGTKTFTATQNIIVKDKEPFFAPHAIQVDDTRHAIYRRLFTNSQYGRNTFATLCLPFTLKDLHNGIHTSRFGKMHVLQMNTDDAVGKGADDNYDATLFFSTATEQTIAKANTPYAIRIYENQVQENYVHFIIEQNGALVEATPSTEQLFGTTVSRGKLTDAGNTTSYAFTHKATFCGTQLDKTEQPTFYFGSRGFVSSLDLSGNYRQVNVFPFRGVYEYTQNGLAKLQSLSYAIGINDDHTTTGIIQPTKPMAGNGIHGGQGVIRIEATSAGRYAIRNLQGATLRQLSLQRGEHCTIAVPSGIYLVNNVKVIVK